MRYFGINTVSHDSGMCIFSEDGNLEFYAPIERINRIKKGTKKNGDPLTWTNKLDCLYQSFPLIPKPKAEDVICYTAGDMNGINPVKALKELKSDSKSIKKIKQTRNHIEYEGEKIKFYSVDHHVCHACCSWLYTEKEEECKFITYDGGGFAVDHNHNYSLTGIISNKIFETHEINTIPSSSKIANILGFASAGKLMGLAGYFPNSKACENYSLDNLESLAGFYKNYIDFLKSELVKELDINKNYVIGGGTALALEVNTFIHDRVKNLSFCPMTDDSGLCVGAAAYGYFLTNKKWPKKIRTPSIVSLQAKIKANGPQNEVEIAKYLANDKIIGLMRGLGECGPRALGNRSILASCNKQNLELVSQRIKKREYYRPLAPVVTEESFDSLFSGPKGKYMQYKVNCTELAKK